jgi:hypothetical protein
MTETTGRRRKAFLALSLVFGPALLLIFIATRSCEHQFKVLDDYGKATSYEFVDARGKTFSYKDFQGDIVVITTLQETCPDSCAIKLWHLNQTIYQHIRKNKRKKMKQVKMISFATDGKGNPVQNLDMYRQILEDQIEGYDPNLWFIAKGDAQKVFDFTHNGKSLLQKGEEFFGGHAFQELILLIDKQNHLRMVLPGNTEGTIRRMKEHIALLQKQYDKQRAAQNK